MKRDSFVTYRSFYEAVKNLDYETIGRVYVAINEFALDHNEVDCDGIAKTIFTLIKPQLEASFRKAISGSKGGKVCKSKSSEELEDKEERNISTSEANPKQTESKPKANNKQTATNVNANVNVNVDIKEKNIKKEKHKHGEYQNVLLTDEEYDKLHKDYPNASELIRYLDEYIEMKGYKAKSHNLAIRKWVIDAVARENRNKPVQEETSNPFLKLLAEEQ